ncbi:permease [Thalassococcus sp. S3]|uniref:permease n=1 Tax=Thalassococcus sp. S3 TaxID=2017482 RepID=UPI0010246899|nr:permease [Thalassococcus sp. S3]QBF32120.1 permease [Thalassococcus sp. S3]
MTDAVLRLSGRGLSIGRYLWSHERVWLAAAAILALVALLDPVQGGESLAFTIRALLQTAPYLILSIGIAAYAGATGADNLIAKAFTGAPVLMIALAAAFGGLSPFCSCGVIPLIAALLAMGVPLSAVMAFWLASPVIDPSMYVLTAGVLGFEFATAKTLAAIGLGLFGGYVTLLLNRAGAFIDPLREGVGNGGCGASSVRDPKPPVWAFWREPARREKFASQALKTTLFLFKWLTLAFVLESLMIAFVPAEWVATAVGGDGIGSVLIATLVGVPAYLNGYAALPLVSGLIEQGMAPGAGMAFLVAGGVTSLPAAIAVWALAKRQVFALYVGLALSGSLASGLLFQAWIGV